jgi:glycosyltransferase involved in cell wall biosynthesis
MLKTVFVGYNNDTTISPSVMHIFHLANALADLGIECLYYARLSKLSKHDFSHLGRPKFRVFGEEISPERLAAKLKAEGGRAVDWVVHSWTPRLRPMLLSQALSFGLQSPLLVHMEDNEEQIYKDSLTHFQGRMLPDLFANSYPVQCRQFLASADGYTCITESLLDFKPAHVPGIFFWPSCEPEIFDLAASPDPEAKKKLGIAPENKVIFYPGAAHMSNVDDVLNLYAAVILCCRQGIPLSIVKYGRYPFDVEDLFKQAGLPERLVDLTGSISVKDLPQVLAASDILVQPGAADAFNTYRFPCKLPMFLASGRPVILPRANIGEHLSHGENCLLLEEGSVEELAIKMRYLLTKPELCAAIGGAGREFARKSFSWKASARKLMKFYAQVVQNRANTSQAES